jgi:hypothetical protein
VGLYLSALSLLTLTALWVSKETRVAGLE